MRYRNVMITSFGYELPPNVVTSDDLEQRLTALYEALRFRRGQLEAITGIRERRFWDRGYRMSQGAVEAGKKALEAAAPIEPGDIGLLIFGGVCRDHLEPATACAVAHGLGLDASARVYDVSNACLGVLNGMTQVADAIELGQIKAGMVVSCESARPIIDATIDRLLTSLNMAVFRKSIATLTGGSGAVAVVLAAAEASPRGHRLMGGVCRNAVAHHALCTWGPAGSEPAGTLQVMETDSAGVLQHGVDLGVATYREFKNELQWPADAPDKIICHQVGSTHQQNILDAVGVPMEKDFTTFRYLGNMGTVSLPLTAAIAAERGFLAPGDRVGFLGIGSGLNCLMLGVRW